MRVMVRVYGVGEHSDDVAAAGMHGTHHHLGETGNHDTARVTFIDRFAGG
jgi:hypothetical protein